MSIKMMRIMQRASFGVALLFHLLMLLSFSIVFLFHTEPHDTPGLYIPSYMSQDLEKPVTRQEQAAKSTASQTTKQMALKNQKDGLPNPQTAKSRSSDSAEKSEPATAAKAIDGVHLIGKKKLDDPLIKILGQAISHHLTYPRIALDFNLRGTAYVGFNIRPDGIVTDVRLVKSSNAGVLDEEAVRAIRMMSPVRNVDAYVKEPRFLVVGIIFG